MYPNGWCPGEVVLQTVTALALWCQSVGVPRGAEAVVAYSTQHDNAEIQDNRAGKELKLFPELWKEIFLWGFFSMLFIHIVASIIAFLMLRKHKYGRFSAACILLIGMCTTFAMCAATSAALGFVLYQAKISLQPIEAMICGISQTALFIFFAFSRFMPTL
ncbi:transmembrane protein 170B-like [Penaeus japonicus]|uniref:transmembrane protein 170B-like n=1 Tax=Penaeus japonicus TaxID=27405 RepID=UPI001C70C20A|nr:transmembrane protein 170B-like [Penaeus japonicus]